MSLRDRDLISIQEARELVARAATAQKKFSEFSQEEVDAVVEACAKAAFENVFRAMVTLLERGISTKGRKGQEIAQAVAALCVGGMVVARSAADHAFADELRDSCMKIALQLTGWSANSQRHHRQAKQPFATGRVQKRSGTNASHAN